MSRVGERNTIEPYTYLLEDKEYTWFKGKYVNRLQLSITPNKIQPVGPGAATTLLTISDLVGAVNTIKDFYSLMGSIDFLVQFLTRSIGVPIHFRVVGELSEGRILLLKVVLTELPRMLSFDFNPYDYDKLSPATKVEISKLIFNRDAPLLSHLRINMGENIVVYPDAPQSRGDLSFPFLKDLRLNCLPFRLMKGYLRPTLTSLDISWLDETQQRYG